MRPLARSSTPSTTSTPDAQGGAVALQPDLPVPQDLGRTVAEEAVGHHRGAHPDGAHEDEDTHPDQRAARPGREGGDLRTACQRHHEVLGVGGGQGGTQAGGLARRVGVQGGHPRRWFLGGPGRGTTQPLDQGQCQEGRTGHDLDPADSLVVRRGGVLRPGQQQRDQHDGRQAHQPRPEECRRVRPSPRGHQDQHHRQDRQRAQAHHQGQRDDGADDVHRAPTVRTGWPG